ncbi:MAG: hypothetical protein AB1626_05920 [Candidatus Micrarchaeota archaeon]
MPFVLAMGLVDVVAAVLLFESGFGDLGFYLSLALLFKGAISIFSSTLVHAMLSVR